MYYELKKCINRHHAILGVIFLGIWGLLAPLFLTFAYWQTNLQIGYENKSNVVESIEEIRLYNVKDTQTIFKFQTDEYINLINSKALPFLKEFLYESAADKAMLTAVAQSYYYYGTSGMHIRKLQEGGKARCLFNVRKALQENNNNYYEKQLQMLKSAGVPQSEYTRFIQYYENFSNISMIVIITFLLLVFSNICSKEYSSKMNLIINSSPINKMKVMRNKMAAIVIIGSGAIFLCDLWHFMILFILGYGKNLQMNLNCLSLDFVYSPYNISVLEYFIFKFLLQQLTIFVTAAAIVLISEKSKSSIITIAVVGIITLGGYALGIIGFDRNVLVRYSLAGGMSPCFIFKDYYGLTVNETVILYPVIYVFWLLCIFFICIWGMFVLSNNRKSNKNY